MHAGQGGLDDSMDLGRGGPLPPAKKVAVGADARDTAAERRPPAAGAGCQTLLVQRTAVPAAEGSDAGGLCMPHGQHLHGGG